MLRTGRIDRGPRRRGDSEKQEQRHAKSEELRSRASDLLQKLPLATAGRYYESRTGDLKKIFAMIVDELRRQYRLGYYPLDNSNDDAVHQDRGPVSPAQISSFVPD